jgi:hypothetical protein
MMAADKPDSRLSAFATATCTATVMRTLRNLLYDNCSRIHS